MSIIILYLYKLYLCRATCVLRSIQCTSWTVDSSGWAVVVGDPPSLVVATRPCDGGSPLNNT